MGNHFLAAYDNLFNKMVDLKVISENGEILDIESPLVSTAETYFIAAQQAGDLQSLLNKFLNKQAGIEELLEAFDNFADKHGKEPLGIRDKANILAELFESNWEYYEAADEGDFK